ncbi:MAG: TlyA family rRNA (cytidine-2'-O)-methyltransferase [Tepidisphaera sp.]
MSPDPSPSDRSPSTPPAGEPKPYVSKGGLKLAHALRQFSVEATGLTCVDLGCSTGGFTDCLLRHGASHVFAVDTAYGELAWTLRKDPRVTVMERENALHVEPRAAVALATLDVSWTPTKLAVPAALRWLAPGGRIIALVKPHYEAKSLGITLPRGGVLDDGQAASIARTVIDALPQAGVRILGETQSPIRGGSKLSGNLEWLVLLEPA